MKCPKCGAEIAPGDVFCGNCGSMALAEEEAAIPSPPAPPAVPPADRARRAVTISIILVIVGVVLCLAGLGLGVAFAFLGQGDELSLAESALSSAICCLTPFALPGIILTAIGGVVWFVWGRKKKEE